MGGALIVKAPASFVLVEILLPCTLTVTSARGAPPALTFPVITSWAQSVAEAQIRRMQIDTILRPARRGTEEFLAVFTAESDKLLINDKRRLVLVK